MRRDENTDPLNGKDVGETVTVTESKTLHSINFTPDVYFGSDRFGDVEISDVEVIEGDEGEAEDIRITWEGDITKQLPRRWDYHRDPVTQEEKSQQRKKKWLSRGAAALSLIVPSAVAVFIATRVMNSIAGKMTVNGQAMTAPSTAETATVMGVILLLAAVIVYGMKGGLPGKV